jgi:hypothetical protein
MRPPASGNWSKPPSRQLAEAVMSCRISRAMPELWIAARTATVFRQPVQVRRSEVQSARQPPGNEVHVLVWIGPNAEAQNSWTSLRSGFR